ncbi:MAG: glyoxal reductase [Candidatus Saccharibacteria bacterium]|jgi:diketogulonate reductase-like aldo/keto reductase|nr:glyoxal reductase [Candidatus Saccharibacteria bacterium]
MQSLIQLNNEVVMPQLGLGVWQAKDGHEVETAVSTALDCGYRLIDTAAVYGNEQGVGRAIAASSVPREDIFVTTKVWNADQGYDQTLAAFNKSLQRLGLDYIDLYLIHWPVPVKDTYIETWRALEKLYADGKVKAIGVSNFTIEYLERLMNESTIVPAVNQIELHPRFSQKELRAFCSKHSIAVESYTPLGGTDGNLLDEPLLKEIGSQYGKSPAQVVLRWHIQNNLIVIPKSVTPSRIMQNIDIFDFELNTDDMNRLDNLNTDTRIGSDPETANFT